MCVCVCVCNRDCAVLPQGNQQLSDLQLKWISDDIILPATFHKQWQGSLKYTGMNSATRARAHGGGGGSRVGGSSSGGGYDDLIITTTNMIPFGIWGSQSGNTEDKCLLELAVCHYFYLNIVCTIHCTKINLYNQLYMHKELTTTTSDICMFQLPTFSITEL